MGFGDGGETGDRDRGGGGRKSGEGETTDRDPEIKGGVDSWTARRRGSRAAVVEEEVMVEAQQT